MRDFHSKKIPVSLQHIGLGSRLESHSETYDEVII